MKERIKLFFIASIASCILIGPLQAKKTPDKVRDAWKLLGVLIVHNSAGEILAHCNAFIVATNIIGTAQHCLDANKTLNDESLSFKFYLPDLANPSQNSIYNIDFDSAIQSNLVDIALVKLKEGQQIALDRLRPLVFAQNPNLPRTIWWAHFSVAYGPSRPRLKVKNLQLSTSKCHPKKMSDILAQHHQFISTLGENDRGKLKKAAELKYWGIDDCLGVPGNSGSVIFNRKGQVIGLLAWGVNASAGETYYQASSLVRKTLFSIFSSYTAVRLFLQNEDIQSTQNTDGSIAITDLK